MRAAKITGYLFMAVMAGAQTRIDLRTQVKSVDFSSADYTLPSKTGTDLPGSCNVGETFFKTDAVAGQNWYLCVADNQWAVQGAVLPALAGNAGGILSTDGTNLFWKTLGGDLTGSPAGVTVNGIQGRALSAAAPLVGQYLVWNGTQWTPQSGAASVFGRTGAVTAQSGDYTFAQIGGTVAGSQLPAAGGDLSGSLTAATVKALQGMPVASGTPGAGQVLTWNGAQWGPQSVTAGVSSVFGRTGTVSAQTGDYSAAQVTNAVDKTAANTFTAGARQTFQSTTSAAGLRVAPSSLPQSALGGDVAMDSGDSNKLKIFDGASWVTLTPTTSRANYAATFSSQTTVSVPGTVHQLGTASLIVECFDSASPSNLVEPSAVTVNPTTYDVSVTFAVAQSGRCVINGYNGGSGGGGAVSSVFGRTGAVVAASADYSFSQISGTVTDAQVATGINAAKIGGGTVTNQSFGYLANVSSDLQTQLNGKLSSTSTANGDATGTFGSMTVQGLQNRTVAKTTPSDGQALVWSAALNQWQPGTVSGGSGGGGGASMASQLGDFAVSLQSATVLAIGTGCTAAAPCNERIGNQVYSITSSATATISSGSGMAYVYLDSNGVLTVGHGMTVSCTGCTAASGVSAFPADVIPLFTWAASNGAWITGGGTDLRGWLSGTSVQAGTGIVVVQSGGHTTVAIDSAVVPTYLAASATLDFPAIPAGTCSADLTFPLTGANAGDAVAAGWPSGLEAGLMGTMRVSASGVIAVRLCALGTTIDPAAATFQAAILRGN